MIPKGIKNYIENFILTDCDDIIIDILKEKLEVNVDREGDEIVFSFSFGGTLIKEDRIDIS